jgi:hypothetical protein
VQQGGDDGRGVEMQVGEDVGHREGMLDEVLAGDPLLPRMGGLG